MRFLTLEEILELHTDVIAQSGGSDGVRDIAAVESALAQPEMTFGADELYPTLAEKAAARGFHSSKTTRLLMAINASVTMRWNISWRSTALKLPIR